MIRLLLLFLPLSLLADVTISTLQTPAIDFWYDYTLTATDKITVDGTESSVTVDDVVYERHTNATTGTSHVLLVQPADPYDVNDLTSVTVEGLDAGVATWNSDTNTIDRVADGSTTAVIVAVGDGKTVKRKTASLSFVETTGDTVDYPVDGAGPKLKEDLWDNILANIAGDATPSLDLYSTWNSPTGTFVRNTDLWCSGDFTGVAFIRSKSTGAYVKDYAATAITSRHVITATHVASVVLSSSYELVFVNTSNQAFTYDIIGSSQHPLSGSDLSIGVLSSTLDASLAVYSLPDSDYMAKMTTDGKGVPTLNVNKDERIGLLVGEMGSDINAGRLDYLGNPMKSFVSYGNEVSPNWSAWYFGAGVGTSGSPAFITNNGTTLLCHLQHFMGGIGYVLADHVAALNAQIAAADADASISTGLTVTEEDWSSYP